MAFEDFKQKKSVVIVYTGESKGKTSASIGLMCRALGRGQKVAYIQFIKHWEVGEHTFIHKIQPLFKNELVLFRGGKGFFNAGDLSEKAVSEESHRKAASKTLEYAKEASQSGEFDVVICDEINNAVHDGLIAKEDLQALLTEHHPNTSLCVTGRNFPEEFLEFTDIATNMTKLKHHFDDKFLANKGIDY